MQPHFIQSGIHTLLARTTLFIVGLSCTASLANDISTELNNTVQGTDLVELSITGPDTTAMVENNKMASNNPAIEAFTINVPDAEIADLQRRLDNTRFPDQLDSTSWEYGTNLAYLRELVEYWRNDFDWRSQEALLNQFDHFTTYVDDLQMHFIHQRSSNPDAIPLLLVHGWPGSISEFYKIIGPLTEPQQHGGNRDDSFHIIAPSLPGFGFSGIPDDPGYSPERIALLLARLMEQLGYEQYALAGGDWGAIINRHLANHYPERLIGLHSNMIIAGPPQDEALRDAADPDELALMEARRSYMQNEVGYQQIQGTKPQTLGYALTDSPAGLAAWIAEKFHGWSDMPQGADGDLDDHFSKDEILTNISIYWFTRTITSSTRIYYENRNTAAIKPVDYIDVPTGVAIFPAEIYLAPRTWVEAAYDLRHWSLMPEGGHFAALEKPDLYLEDVRAFYRLLR